MCCQLSRSSTDVYAALASRGIHSPALAVSYVGPTPAAPSWSTYLWLQYFTKLQLPSWNTLHQRLRACRSRAGGACCICACRGVLSPPPAVCAAPTPVIYPVCSRCHSACRGAHVCTVLHPDNTVVKRLRTCFHGFKCVPRHGFSWRCVSGAFLVQHTVFDVMMDNEAVYNTCRRIMASG